MTVTAYIDINTPTGRRIVRELETHKRVVKIVYNEPALDQNDTEETIAWEDAEVYLWKNLEKKYGVDLRNVLQLQQ